MKRAHIITIALLTACIIGTIILLAVVFSDDLNHEEISIIKVFNFSETEMILLQQGVKSSAEGVAGRHCSVPTQFVKDTTSKRWVPMSGHYVWIIGAKPIAINARGVLICEKKDDDITNYSFICRIQNKNFDAFFRTPPFTFIEKKVQFVESLAASGTK
jgi:hypothetical protein